YASNLSAITGYEHVATNQVSGAALEALLEKNDPAVTMSGLTAPDDYTVVVKLTGAAGWFESAIAQPSVAGMIVDQKVVKGNFENWFFFSSRRRHTRSKRDWSSDVCSSDLNGSLRRSTCSFSESCAEGGRADHCRLVGRPVLHRRAYFGNPRSSTRDADPCRPPRRSEERRVGKGCRSWSCPA